MKIRPKAIRTGISRISPFLFGAALALSLASCGKPTYPKEKLNEAVKEVAKAEYNMDVEVASLGSTLGVYFPLKGLLDPSFTITEAGWEQIGNLVQVASRVALSTDADIKFYCVVVKDERIPEIQVVIIKYVDDVKRGMLSDISRDESLKRTLFSVNLTPQAEKERSVEMVFNKLGLDAANREKVLNEFFRSEPTELRDIGYWRGRFYLKDITLPEFLASQMANRIKIDFTKEKEYTEKFKYLASHGAFAPSTGKGYFIVSFKLFDQPQGPVGDSVFIEMRREKLRKVIQVARDVVAGYQFRDFDFVEFEDQLENARVWVNADDLYDFNAKKTPLESVAKTTAGYTI